MKQSLIALAAALIAALAWQTPRAEAHGIRIGFGYPIGVFTARQSGYSGAGCRRRKPPVYAYRSAPRHKMARLNTLKEHLRKRAVVMAAKKDEDTPRAKPDDSTVTPPPDTTTPATADPVADTAAAKTDMPAADAHEAPADLPLRVKKPDCKKFVPSVGLTITVPCD